MAGIDNLGHTLEWWCAEWFRRLPLQAGQVPVRYGVVLNELLREGDIGDIDVLVLLDDALVLVECKSSPWQVDAVTLQRWPWRSMFLHPTLSLLLIDTSPLQCRKLLRAVKRNLARCQIFPVQQDEEQILFWKQEQDVEMRRSCSQLLPYGASPLCAALVGKASRLETVLAMVLQVAHLL